MIIQVKDLQVFENNEAKPSTSLLEYEKTPIFQDFLLKDNDIQTLEPKIVTPSIREDATSLTPRLRRKVKLTLKAKKAKSITYCLSQKFEVVEKVEDSHAS